MSQKVSFGSVVFGLKVFAKNIFSGVSGETAHGAFSNGFSNGFE